MVVGDGSIIFSGRGRSDARDGRGGRRLTGFMGQCGTDPAGHFRRNAFAQKVTGRVGRVVAQGHAVGRRRRRRRRRRCPAVTVQRRRAVLLAPAHRRYTAIQFHSNQFNC